MCRQQRSTCIALPSDLQPCGTVVACNCKWKYNATLMVFTEGPESVRLSPPRQEGSIVMHLGLEGYQKRIWKHGKLLLVDSVLRVSSNFDKDLSGSGSKLNSVVGTEGQYLQRGR
eukprot:TRINITY_DN24130_c0_g1_i1.p3 TRINITY_DN24130_c0_g1~~TRINITY_DN24130_c0_g1_i1.p3  ORF type:complete len:115 (+),score=4.00 TRINITY_DN24130_c0_g1_i1:426-770(+)